MVNRPTKLIIWDWNGTLLDDTALCFRIANEMRAERGMLTMGTIEEYRRVFGFPVIDYYRRMGYTFEKESYEEISVEFLEKYAAGLPSCPLQPGAEQTLSAVRERGYRQVLLSATGADRLYGQAAHFGLPRYFHEVIGAENNLAGGKEAQARELIVNSGLSPNEALFIGDTDHDYAVSRAAGCRCLLLTAGHHPRSLLETLGVPLIGALPEVLGYLDGESA